jgi:hypothetical protein
MMRESLKKKIKVLKASPFDPPDTRGISLVSRLQMNSFS